MRSVLKSWITQSVVILLATFIVGLVLNPNRIPVIQALRLKLGMVSPPYLVVHGSLSWHLNPSVHPVVISDYYSSLKETGRLTGLLEKMGITRRSVPESVAYNGSIVTDFYGNPLFKFEHAINTMNDVDFSDDGKSAAWIGFSDGEIVVNFQDMVSGDLYGKVGMDTSSLRRVVNNGVLLSADGSACLYMTILARLNIRWVDSTSGEYIERVSSEAWNKMNWDAFVNVPDYRHLLCDISPDGQEYLVVHRCRMCPEIGIELQKPKDKIREWAFSISQNDTDMWICPTFLPSGEEIVCLRFQLDGKSPEKVDLLYCDMGTGEGPIVIAELPALSTTFENGRLYDVPAFMLLNTAETEEPELLIICGGTSPYEPGSGVSGKTFVNHYRLSGSPPVLNLIDGFEIPRLWFSRFIVDDYIISRGDRLINFNEFKTGKRNGRELPGNYRIVGTSGYRDRDNAE